jgi:hypothetical protein
MTTKVTNETSYAFDPNDELGTLRGLLEVVSDDLAKVLLTYKGDDANKLEQDLVNARGFLGGLK